MLSGSLTNWNGVVSTDANSGIQELHLGGIDKHIQKIRFVTVKCRWVEIVKCHRFVFLVTSWGTTLLFLIAQAPCLEQFKQFFTECCTLQMATGFCTVQF